MAARDSLPRWVAPAVALLTVALLAAMLLAIAPLREALGAALSGETDRMREDLRAIGVWGAVVLFLLVQVHTVVFYPSEIVLVVAGYVYGIPVGLALMVVAWGASGVCCWGLGRTLGRPVLHSVFGAERIGRLERLLERQGAFPLLAARLVPIVPHALTGYVAGALRVPLGRFAWTTVVGYLPLQTAVVVLGHRLEELSPTDPVLWGAVVAMLALLLASRPLLRRLEA